MFKNILMTHRSTAIFVKKLDPRAVVPTTAWVGDVGFDLYALEDVTLEPNETKVIGTGLALTESPQHLIIGARVVAVPFLKIEGRSGLASKGVFPIGGIVDPTYRGEIKVVLHNGSNKDPCFLPATKAVAQIVIYYTLANVEEKWSVVKFLEDNNRSDETPRGVAGFGSTDDASEKKKTP